jgi:nucleoid-associated protein EbfC
LTSNRVNSVIRHRKAKLDRNQYIYHGDTEVTEGEVRHRAIKVFSVAFSPCSLCLRGWFLPDLEATNNVFKSLGNLANIGSLMKQAQEMGGRMQAIQDELKTKRATGNSGGGLVEVEVNGLGEALAVRIDPSLFEKGEREMIEDLLPAAFNAAQAKAKQMHAEAMQSLAGGLQIPGLSDAIQQLGGGDLGGGKS